LVMAFLWMILFFMLDAGGSEEKYFYLVAKAGIFINLVLFAFNLFPLPPLDGGRIMTSILPNRYAYNFSRVEPYGFFIVLGLMMLNLLQYWMVPVISGANILLSVLITPLKFLLN
jgi:Zn-dependent protease